MDNSLIWVEINKQNLIHNVNTLRERAKGKAFCACVKSNAYGHCLVEVGTILDTLNLDFLSVNALFEAEKLQDAGIKTPVYIMGYIAFKELETAIKKGFSFVICNLETLEHVDKITKQLGLPAKIHLEVETGLHRQGIDLDHINPYVDLFKSNSLLQLEGLCSHFANIEDTTNHSFAHSQISKFQEIILVFENLGLTAKYKHMANSASTILMEETHFSMVRPGISIYGLWPSNETYVSSFEKGSPITLKPVLSLKTKVGHIKSVKSGSFIGYGCTYKTTSDSRIAIIPIGYYDGFPRSLSNVGYVLINGKRAAVRGRVCMNMIMVDITDIPGVNLEDTVIIIGEDQDETLNADGFAKLAGTINYEAVARLRENIPKMVI